MSVYTYMSFVGNMCMMMVSMRNITVRLLERRFRHFIVVFLVARALRQSCKLLWLVYKFLRRTSWLVSGYGYGNIAL